jgi:hypothetical protein
VDAIPKARFAIAFNRSMIATASGECRFFRLQLGLKYFNPNVSPTTEAIPKARFAIA